MAGDETRRAGAQTAPGCSQPPGLHAPAEVKSLVEAGILDEPARVDAEGAPVSWRAGGPYRGVEVDEALLESWIGRCDALSARLSGLACTALALYDAAEMRSYLSPVARYIDFPAMRVPFSAVAPGEIDLIARATRRAAARAGEIGRLRSESAADPVASIRSRTRCPRRVVEAGPLLSLECELGFEERGPISQATASRLYPPRARMRELLLCGGPAWPVVSLPSAEEIVRSKDSLSGADFRRCCAAAVSDAAMSAARKGVDEDAGTVPKATQDQIASLRAGRYDPEAAFEGYLREASSAVADVDRLLGKADPRTAAALRECLRAPAVTGLAALRLAALLMIGLQGYVLREVRPSTGASPPALTRERLEMLRTARPKKPTA